MDEAEKHHQYHLRHNRMTKVQQLKEMPNGQGVGGFAMVITKTKKLTEHKNHFIHQVVFADDTGEILTDIKLLRRTPFTRNVSVRVIVGKVQDIADGGKKLYVDQWDYDVVEEPDMLDSSGGLALTQEIRSKIMCWQVAAYIQAGNVNSAVEFSKSKELKEIVDNIMKG